MSDPEFRTPVVPERISHLINHEDSTTLMGSCFVENIGSYLRERKFPADVNPFGVLYNPLSIARGLGTLLGGDEFTARDLRERNGLWFSFSHHGSFSSPDPEICLRGMNERLNRGREHLKGASWLILTLGTARVHERDGEVVANRHKLPHGEFQERMLSTAEIARSLGETLVNLRAFNPTVRVLFTVSPIRHWKDGAVANQHSKALLICAVRELAADFDFVDYFPAYEIMLDDLRDYRFYDSDMVHPSREALDYIRRRFREACIDPACFPAIEEFEALARAMAHRPLHPDSPDHRAFLERHLRAVAELAARFPHLDFSRERAHFDPA